MALCYWSSHGSWICFEAIRGQSVRDYVATPYSKEAPPRGI